MRKFLVNNWVIIVIGSALIFSMIMAIRNYYVIGENSAQLHESEVVKERTKEILTRTMHGLDLGVRGFTLTKGDNMLIPYREAIEKNAATFKEIEFLLQKQNYPDIAKLDAVRTEVDAYINFCRQMIETARQDDTMHVVEMLKQDKGYAVWKKYDEFSQPLYKFEDELHRSALEKYNAAVQSNLMLQISVVLLTLPALFIFIRRIKKEREARQGLITRVQQNDQNFVFNPGTASSTEADVVINTSIQNVRQASDFIKSMTDGDYSASWKGLSKENEILNEETLAGSLVQMQEQLRKVKQADDQRNWLNGGLAEFSEIVRNHQNNSKELADRCVSFLAKYLKAQQCSLFVLEGEDDDKYLRLASCYAFEKKKWLEQRVEIGSGLVGQAYLEGDFIQLKELPKGYTKITSGLGDATPNHLVIVPLKYDIHTVAVVEIASFFIFEEYHIEFLKKAGEFLASAILNSQNTNKMSHLLEQARITEEGMRQREEEMRQNMEELQATQEELVRKEQEMQRRPTASA